MITFSQNQNEQKALNELLFAGRNKAYGPILSEQKLIIISKRLYFQE